MPSASRSILDLPHLLIMADESAPHISKEKRRRTSLEQVFDNYWDTHFGSLYRGFTILI